VRVAVVGGRRQTDLFQQCDGAFARGTAAGKTVHAERLGQCLADGASRIERRIGILEYDLHAAAQPLQRGSFGLRHVDVGEAHLA